MADQKKIRAGDGSIVIGGDVTHSNIVMGDSNIITQNAQNLSSAFALIYRAVDEGAHLSPTVKQDIKAEIKDVEAVIQKNDHPDENSILRHLRNVQRMAPDILEVALAALTNPVSGLGTAGRKIIQKMADEAKQEK
jgi:predicted transport protein